MKKALFFVGLFIAATLLWPRAPLRARSSPPSADTCRDTIQDELRKEQRILRSVLFGEKASKEAAIGAIRYDKQGRAWVKMGKNRWDLLLPEAGAAAGSWSDVRMDGEAESEAMKGIFETKRVLTSDLVTPLTHAMDVFGCRLETLCGRVKQSTVTKGSDPVDFDMMILGCARDARKTLPGCHLSDSQPVQSTDAGQYCDKAIADLFEREAALLKLATEADASQRLLLQFSGTFDLFLLELRTPIKDTLQSVGSIVRELSRIPCFITSCDATPRIP